MAKSMTAKSSLSSRMRSIKRVLWVVLLLNIAVAAAKYFYGLASSSASMQADGIHSLFDSVGNIVGILGIALAARPADATHPYGHSKFETSASLAIGMLLLLAAGEVGISAITKLFGATYTTQVSPLSFVIMLITFLVNVGVTLYERACAKRLQSEVLLADASHTLSDAMVSIGVIVGLIFVALGFPAADPIAALVVTLAIVCTAFDVFKRALSTLSDHARIPEQDLMRYVQEIPGVKGVHHIRTRGTQGEVYADLHVLVEPSMPVSSAHELSEEVEKAIKKHFSNVAEVLVHIEPNDGHID